MPTDKLTTPRRACFECGQPAEIDHHIVPRIRGGTKTVPLCEPCHAKAHHRDRNLSTAKLTKEALAAKRARGERCGGHIPYGFKLASDGKTLVRNIDEQKVIKRIIRMRKQGSTLQSIADWLNNKGYHRRTGAKWEYTFIHLLLRPHAVVPECPVKTKRMDQPIKDSPVQEIPFGYRLCGKRLIRDANEQVIMKLYTRLQSTGHSSESIRAHLIGLGLIEKSST
jgi:Recombinase